MKKETVKENFENLNLKIAAKEMHGNGAPDYEKKLCDFKNFLKSL